MANILITGASGGIGGALCSYFESKGYSILAHARNGEKAANTVEGTNWTPVWCDVTREDEVAAMAEQISAVGGVCHVVHNAGLLSKTTETGPHGIGMQGEINVLAPYQITSALMPMLGKADKPWVSVISSTATMFAGKPLYTRLAEPNGSSLFGHYALSKAAANTCVEAMARKWPDVHFASTEPGFVNTKMTVGNSSMPWVMSKLAGLAGTAPEVAARRCFDALLYREHPSGTVIQSGKPVTGKAWSSDKAHDELAALFENAGVSL